MHGIASLALLALAPSPPRAAAAGAVAVHVDDGGGLVDVAAAAIAIGHGGGGGGRFVIAVGWGGFTRSHHFRLSQCDFSHTQNSLRIREEGKWQIGE